VLGRESGARSQLLAWIGLSGVPPFGGFTGRILIVIAASQVSFTVAGLLLFAMGLQLAAGARGIRAAASAAADHLTLWRELLGLLVAAATLLLGLVPSQALGVVMGLHP
jgi:formate hydrogenlyase subunit 3/multisubunit Na+/H+ antiporter MnhD subunit